MAQQSLLDMFNLPHEEVKITCLCNVRPTLITGPVAGTAPLIAVRVSRGRQLLDTGDHPRSPPVYDLTTLLGVVSACNAPGPVPCDHATAWWSLTISRTALQGDLYIFSNHLCFVGYTYGIALEVKVPFQVRLVPII
jgi:hypothetical protein